MDTSAAQPDVKRPGARGRPARTTFGAGTPFVTATEPGQGSSAAHEYVEACLMLALGERPAYGYELKGELDQLGLESLDRGRIYRALRAMEAEGLVVSHWETASRGPARRTYDLTSRGHDRLRAQVLAVRHQRRQLSRFLTRYERAPSPAQQSGAVA